MNLPSGFARIAPTAKTSDERSVKNRRRGNGVDRTRSPPSQPSTHRPSRTDPHPRKTILPKAPPWPTVDENFLMTFTESDAYPDRPSGQYFGVWPNAGGKTPVWPEGGGKRVFAYSKQFQAVPRL